MGKITRCLWGMLLLVLAGNCSTGEKAPCFIPQFMKEESPKIVLITVDGVRWQEMFEGADLRLHGGRRSSAREILPNVYRYFVDEGSAFGKDSLVATTGTMHISLPGYLEMTRGYSTVDCITNLCEPELKTTLLDFFETAAVFSSWDTIRKATTSNPDRFVINSGRNYRSTGHQQLGLRDVKDFVCHVGHDDYRPDQYTIAASFDYLEKERPQFLWVALGDTDEYAHDGNYKGYLSAIKAFDYFVGELIQSYDKNTVFIITTDHGRSADWRKHGIDNDSGRVWLMMHGKGVQPLGFVKLDSPRSLSDLMPTILKITHGIKSKRSFI